MMEFEPTLTMADIMNMFNCTPWQARTFLLRYGVRMSSRQWVIGLRKVRELQMSGEAAEHFKGAKKK